MRIFNKGTLSAWVKRHSGAEAGLETWRRVISEAVWITPNEMLHSISSDVILTKPAAMLPKGLSRVIFDVSGNRFRLMAHVNFERQYVFLKWFGTHAEYDKVDFASLKLEERI